MKRVALDDAKNSRELCAALERAPGLVSVRQCGSHRAFRGPSGTVIVPCHNGDVARGTLKSILRMAALAGLAVIVVCIFVTFVL